MDLNDIDAVLADAKIEPYFRSDCQTIVRVNGRSFRIEGGPGGWDVMYGFLDSAGKIDSSKSYRYDTSFDNCPTFVSLLASILSMPLYHAGVDASRESS